MKLTKSVCLNLDTQMVIEQVMRKYRKNYSQAIGLIIDQWARFKRDISELRAKKEKENRKVELEALSKSKVLKDEK